MLHPSREPPQSTTAAAVRGRLPCKCAEDVSNVYATFWHKLGDDYSKEFAVLNRLASEFAVGATTGSTQ